MIDLKTDPYENSWDGSAYWERFAMEHTYLVLPAVAKVSAYLATFRSSRRASGRPASRSIRSSRKSNKTTKSK
jgi:arylsulfatase